MNLSQSPLQAVLDFLKHEVDVEAAKQYADMRLVGYPLSVDFNRVTIVTCDAFKQAVGGVPRNSFLIMTLPFSELTTTPYFTLLRVLDAAPIPLSQEVQQVYFDLQKRAMPTLDAFTQAELQWSALSAVVLGMFYPQPDRPDRIEFSGDVHTFVSPHQYRVYAPDEALLDLILNTLVPSDNRFLIGALRLSESRLALPDKPQPTVPVFVSTNDLLGARTAFFGKTRLGKSNVIKVICQSILEATQTTRNVGQLIFDLNGEYANDNPQDNNRSLRSAYPDRCLVYALTPKPATPSRALKLDFYEHPDRSHRILANLLAEAERHSIYVDAFRSLELPAIEDLNSLPPDERLRGHRHILMYWAVLYKAGYPADEFKLKKRLSLDPRFNATARHLWRPGDDPFPIVSLDDLLDEMQRLVAASREHELFSTSGKPLLDADDEALLGFLKPRAGAGPSMLQAFRMYHDPSAGNFVREILVALDAGMTVILDLGNANDEVMRYFAEELSAAVLYHQVEKFTANRLLRHFIQLCFEEAHNVFPLRNEATLDIYRRLAKEGGKYHLGLIYSTQSVTTINRDLLAQTENFFVAHLSSRSEVDALAQVNAAFDSVTDDILHTRTPGYVYMLTKSHRFVVPLQARKFQP